MGLVNAHEQNTQEVVNISSETVKFVIGEMKIVLKPGEKIAVHKNYAFPRKLKKDRDPLPSVVELETGGRVVPTSDKRARAFRS